MAANDRPLTSILNSSPPRQTDQSLSSHSSATPVVNTASRQTTNSFQLTSGSTSYPVHASYFRPGQSNYQSPYVSQPSHLPPRTSQAADDSPFSEGTAQVIAKINAKVKAKSLAEADHGQSSWQMARDPAVAEMTSQARPTTDVTATPPPPNPNRTGGRRGRGPRRRRSPIATGAITLENASASGFQTPPGRGRGRGFGRGHRSRGGRGSRGGIVRGNGAKSKRTRGEDGEDFEDSDSSETFTPLPPQSRFGRKIFQANSNNPVIKIDDETPAISTVAASTTPVEKGPARKKAGFRRTPGGVTAVCKNCERGHSPASNAIVFCDGCNMPWHQYCHDPPIKDEIVLIAETEWYCSDCGVMKEARARLDGKVAGDGLSLLEVCSPILSIMFC